MPTAALDSFAMPKKTAESKATTLRVKTDLLKRARAFANAHHLQPTLTQLFEAAISEYLDRHASDVAPHKSRPQ